VKTTPYFEMRMKERPEIDWSWCERVRRSPLEVVQQDDGRFQMWGYIEEAGKYLRVITLEDCETLDNSFFDRRYEARQ
jgi:hypothetical protein